MPAFRFKEFTGNRFFLANLEYRVSVGSGVRIAFFSDIGDAWDQPLREKFDPESDMGIGIESEDGMIVMQMPHADRLIAPIVYTVPLQLLAYHVAVLKGTDVDQPRNLAKSVTVE